MTRGQKAGWVVILCSGFLLFFAGTWGGIVGILGLVAGAWLLVDADLLHPLTWFLPFYVLYGIAAPLLDVIGFRGIADDQSGKVLALQWFAGVGFIFGAGSRRYLTKTNPASIKNIKMPAYALYFISLGLTGLYLIGVVRSGAQSKYDLVLSAEPLLMLFPAFSLLLVSYMVLVTSKLVKGKVPAILVISVIVWHFLAVLFAGERDLLVRVLWVTVMLWHVWRGPLSRRWLLICAFVGIASIPVLGKAKNVLLNKETPQISFVSLAPEVLNDEFYTASGNLAVLLSREQEWRPFKYGKTLLWDLQRAAVPGTLVRWGTNPGSWFNQQFFAESVASGGGQGFTLVGEGYMNFGVIGAWLWLGLLGLFARCLYRMSSRHIIWQMVYIGSMPLFVFITRSDFSILFAQFSKHILLPVIALFVAGKVLREIVATPGSLSTLQEST